MNLPAHTLTYETSKLPPMLQQYVEYKGRYPEALLLFQVGDFYETFFEDAVTIARVINLTLTSRDKNSPNPIPMAGVPIAVVDSYIERLVAQGYSVALVSQNEGGGGKGAVTRKLERIITPGVKVLARSSSEREESILVSAFFEREEDGAFAYSHIQSGKIFVKEHIHGATAGEELRMLSPSEVVVTRSGPLVKKLPQFQWASGVSIKVRADTYGDVGASSTRELSTIPGYSGLSSCAKRAVRLLLAYIDETTVDVALSIHSIEVARGTEYVQIDASTRANLELVQNQRDGRRDGSLYELLDRSSTFSGSRAIRSALLQPSTDRAVIRARHEVVEFFKDARDCRTELQRALEKITDLERIATRVELRCCTPRELGALRDARDALQRIQDLISSFARELPPLLQEILSHLKVPAPLIESRLSWFAGTPPLSASEGGIFLDGVDAEIDRIRQIKIHGREWIAELENKERLATGISSLKIRSNNVIGFYFEVTKTHLSKIPEHFIRRQSTVQGERFTSLELQKREEEVVSAEGQLFAYERALFEEIRNELLVHITTIRSLASSVGQLDMLVAFADIADREAYIRPEMVEENVLSIVDGKHPVIAKLLQGNFIPNSLTLSHQHKFFMVVTGPNMGGKSTFLRQAGILTIMAHAGSFVPAVSATIGIVDKVFARIGASDNMAEGESTFMVEMREASHIVARATERSLLLIDELGRGTATADGLAIAHAIVEWLLERVQCRALFATHYHELTHLERMHRGLGNLSVGSADHEGEVIFTHAITEGPANKSYGIEVARLAGLPKELLSRARTYIQEYEQASAAPSRVTTKGAAQLSFFDESTPSLRERIVMPKDYATLEKVRDRLQERHPDDMTPREALGLVAELFSLVQSS